MKFESDEISNGHLICRQGGAESIILVCGVRGPADTDISKQHLYSFFFFFSFFPIL